MEGDMGHKGGLINPRPWRGRCQAGYSNTGGPTLTQKRAPCKKIVLRCQVDSICFTSYIFGNMQCHTGFKGVGCSKML